MKLSRLVHAPLISTALTSPMNLRFLPNELRRVKALTQRRVSLVKPRGTGYNHGMTGTATGLASTGRHPAIEVVLDGGGIFGFQRDQLYFPDDKEGYNQRSLTSF